MKTVLVPTLVAAKNIDSLNASFIDSEKDIDNGMVFSAGDYSKEQVYDVAAVSELTNLYMAFSPEDTIITDAMGNDYAVAEAGKNKLQFAAAAVEGLSYKVIDKNAYISIGGATAIGSQRVAAYLLECVAI